MRINSTIIFLFLYSVYINGQSAPASKDSMLNSISAVFQNIKFSGKMTIVIDTTTAFSPIDYSSTETISQYEVPEEVANYCNKLENYEYREALMKKYTKHNIVTSKYCPPTPPIIIKKN